MKKRLFSGVQPSGNLHIGNYLGAIQQWVTLQEEYEAIFCVVDLHAITVPQDPVALRKKTLEAVKTYLAAGIDSQKCTLFVQSHVKEHAELAWILNTIARLGDLEKMTQFKDKAKDGRETAGVGLFDYPVLMAADILLYDTAIVPVGEDQIQHVELARTLARRFNDRFGETFVIPEGKIQKEGARIMGLDDPTKKMSKSAASEYNYIALTDDADTVRKKIRKAVTDSGSEIVYSDEKPAIKNLMNMYSLLSRKSTSEVEAMYSSKGPARNATHSVAGGYGDFKNDLAEVVIGFLVPFQERLRGISDEDVLRILHEGREKIRPIAVEKMRTVFDRVGLISY
ncbi:MAG: tryptophan--tRNA ligase [Patescibacteria group bacterium]